MVDAVKKALRKLWTDTCTVYEYEEYAAENGSTQLREVAVLENEPCKLSFPNYRGLQPVEQTDSAAEIIQSVKLFIDEKTEVKAGSKIVVKRRDLTFTFKQSGLAAVFTNHREIPLLAYEDFA
jgi:hypothetical protein